MKEEKGCFDKFAEDLEKRENAERARRKAQDVAAKQWPARKLRERYQEKTDNRITWSR